MTAYIGLGSNLGNRLLNLKKAVTLLKSKQKVKLLKISPCFESEPLYLKQQPQFLNAVIKIRTGLSAIDLLSILKKIERKLLRQKGERFGPRTIDLDLLLYGRKKLKTQALMVPHPRILEREFVLKPLSEIVRVISYGPKRVLLKNIPRLDQNVRLYKRKWFGLVA